ncbi:MAG TPA: extracellular solute-binding protein [Jatrophihabitantaceae bacterium]|nr:extracellular solute-binding protein [Jatrophihabitantaceae bacterium]
MRPKLFTLAVATVLLFAACSSSASPSPSAGGATSAPASGSTGSAEPSGSGATGAWDTASITGTAILSGWRSSPEEGEALTQTLLGFPAVYPNVTVDYQPIAGDYRTVMITKISSHEVPDLFYVNADYATEWIAQGFLEPLDDLIAKAGIDTSQFFDGYLSIFKGKDGKIYGLPKDGNTIGMAYNSDLVTAPPTTMDELVTAAKALKGKSDLKAPLCLNPGLDRGLAFIYAQGGSLLTEDGTASAIDTPASKAAVQWYMDLFKDGLGMTAADMGSGWCGEALGKKQAAITFEGGWLDPSMTGTFPDVKYAWAEMPTGSSGSPVTISFTVSYSIGADSVNKDQALVLLSYLAGKDGMTKWTQGGVALPSRKDVPTPAGKDVLAKGSAYAKPGSGFMPGYVDVQKAFQDAFTAQIQGKTFDAGPVVAATKAAIDKALSQ